MLVYQRVKPLRMSKTRMLCTLDEDHQQIRNVTGVLLGSAMPQIKGMADTGKPCWIPWAFHGKPPWIYKGKQQFMWLMWLINVVNYSWGKTTMGL